MRRPPAGRGQEAGARAPVYDRAAFPGGAVGAPGRWVNAAEAMGAAGEVVLEAEPRPGAVDLVVADSGPGVAPELRAQIFEPFFTTRPKGTGLGLAVARQIVEAHEGTISVGDRPGGGARRAGGRMMPRVLVVDDEERMAAVVAAALGRAGYECETFHRGEDALVALERRGADVVVTDWKMPGMDGVELLRRVHEIGEVTPEFQAKLLRVLQEGEVQRVGGGAARAVDVRVVAATNRVLRDELSGGRFREDLFFRLNVIPVQLAPLRERPEDVLPLARHFLARHLGAAGRRLQLSAAALAALLGHPWPGNVRELENAIERGVVLARGETIEPEDLLLHETVHGADRSPDAGSLQAALDTATAARLRAALDAARGNRAEAARQLGIDRTTLYRLMKRLGV